VGGVRMKALAVLTVVLGAVIALYVVVVAWTMSR
jgi:hypothetical protein